SHLLSNDQAGQTQAKAAFNNHREEMTRMLGQYADKLISGEMDRRLLTDYRDLSREWAAGAESAMSLDVAGNHEEAHELLNGSMAEIGMRLSKVSAEWIQHNEELALSAAKSAVVAIDHSRKNMLFSVGLAMAVAGWLGYWTYRRIVHPIRG